MTFTPAQKAEYFATRNRILKQLQPAEKVLVAYYEINWHLKQYVPSVEEVTEHLRKKYPTVKQTSVNYYLQRKPVINALDNRGIPWRQHSREDLTDQQMAAALTMMNFADTRSNKDKLDQVGVSVTQYLAWLLDPTFKNFVQSLADQNIKNIDPVAKTEFAKKVHEGDWKAIEFYLKNTGAVNGNEAPQSEVLIRMLIEIIQKHVKDSDVILAIAEDMKRAWANRTLETSLLPGQPALEAAYEVLEDNELTVADARKQLGI